MEIERKFLVDRLPKNLDDYVATESSQGYLDIENPDFAELRVRKKVRLGKTTYLCAIKTGGGLMGLQRDEVEIEIPQQTYDAMWPQTEGKRIEKTRYEIPYHDDITKIDSLIELDVYYGNLRGLLTAEVEFNNIEESVAFIRPSWFGKEITSDSRYKNKNLAINGIPK